MHLYFPGSINSADDNGELLEEALAARKKSSSKDDTTEGEEDDEGDELDDLKVPNATFLVYPSGDARDLKKIKPGQLFYPYITEDGRISTYGGIFADDPDIDNQYNFMDGAKIGLGVVNYSGKDYLGDDSIKPELLRLQEETLKLKLTKIRPSYLEIKKVTVIPGDGADDEYVLIQGTMFRAADTRLAYLPQNKSTAFGQGEYDPKKTKGVFDGTFFHEALSPFRKEIIALIEKQKKHFYDRETLQKEGGSDAKIERLTDIIKETQRQLKTHANEIFQIDHRNDLVYYVSADGAWLAEHTPGLRSLDLDDRVRAWNQFKQNRYYNKDLGQGLYEEDLEHLGKLNFNERYKPEHFAPVLFSEFEGSKAKDEKEFTARQEKIKNLRPEDGPLATGDIPGLREGIELFPHQSLLLASLKGRDRMMVDADPGAGKTLLIVCDILMQMKAGKVKRPLVVMPEPLLAQFAGEVRQFSELNPWIINTESVKNWKDGDQDKFMEDASKTPPNTVFLTSYNWISREWKDLPNGVTRKGIHKGRGFVSYQTSRLFTRPKQLMKVIGIDSVWKDECHMLKSNSNQAWASLVLAELPIIRGFTGTIMPGGPYDVTGPMDVIHSGVFGTEDEFLSAYTPYKSINSYNEDAPKEIRKKLRAFGMISVRKSAWAHLLPNVHREYHFVELNKAQQKTYDAILQDILDELRKDATMAKYLEQFEEMMEDEGASLRLGNLLAKFVPLDIFLNSPGTAHKLSEATLKEENAISPKSEAINKICKDHFKKADAGKILILVQFKDGAKNILDNMPRDLRAMAAYYEGGMTEVLQKLKSHDDSSVRIMVGVDRTLRTGHNIQSVNCIIHADLTWLPGDISQREARSARIGQKRDVYTHYVIAKNTAEMLKMARIISAEHTIAKANSDFDEETVLQPIKMSLAGMVNFRALSQLQPYLDRRGEIEQQMQKQAAKESKFFGTKMMKPRGYTSIDTVFEEAKVLSVLPGTGAFVGESRSYEVLKEKDLSELPEKPRPVKLLEFHLQNWNGDWQLVVFKSVDPQGFLRRYGFDLMRNYYYYEVPSKAAAETLLKKISKYFEITNLKDLEEEIHRMKVTKVGTTKGLSKMAKKDRSEVKSGFIEITAAPKTDIAFEFQTYDGAPLFFVDTLKEEDEEVAVLKKLGFEMVPPSWQKDISRTTLIKFLQRLTKEHPEVRFVDWEEFKENAKLAFRGVDLEEFDEFAKVEKKGKK